MCLRELGCDTATGWLWSRAAPPEEFAARATKGLDIAGPGTSHGVVVPMRRA
ncbi:MAG: hypothetical protein ACT4OX_08305 [Actinomycetota bacterium]